MYVISVCFNMCFMYFALTSLMTHPEPVCWEGRIEIKSNQIIGNTYLGNIWGTDLKNKWNLSDVFFSVKKAQLPNYIGKRPFLLLLLVQNY